MKHNLNLLIAAHLLAAASSCTAMENKPTIFELTTRPDERYAFFITNNHAIINGKECCIFDLTTNTRIKTIKDAPAKNILHMHPNKKLFTLTNNEKITMYDIETATETWSHPLTMYDTPFCFFNPSKPTFFMWHAVGLITNLREYNYHTNQISDTAINNIFLPGSLVMDIDPTGQQLCVQDERLNMYTYDENNCLKKTKEIKNCTTITHIKYSPNGSLIACHSQNVITIINPDKNPSNLYTLQNNNNAIGTIEFHPNSSVLAALILEATIAVPKTEKDYNIILRYFDTTSGLISELSLSDLYPLCVIKTSRAISFTPNGAKIMIKLADKAIVLPVPFEVIYQDITKEKFASILFCLQNYKPDVCESLPQEINQLLMHTLLETYKR